MVLALAWAVVLPVSFVVGWAYAVAFVSFCSIYANAGIHWSAWQGARSEES
jgi:hypothetical protein